MSPAEPKVDLHFMPQGTKRVVYAENQPEYLPLPSYRTPDGRVVSAWKPNAGELALLNNGVPVYLTLHGIHGPLPPVMMTIGPPDLRDRTDPLADALHISYGDHEQAAT